MAHLVSKDQRLRLAQYTDDPVKLAMQIEKHIALHRDSHEWSEFRRFFIGEMRLIVKALRQYDPDEVPLSETIKDIAIKIEQNKGLSSVEAENLTDFVVDELRERSLLKS
jgi:hypothetical protein